MADTTPGIVSGERFLARDDLIDRALRGAQGLRDMGVGPGDAVAIVLRNDIAFLEATLAAQAAGAYPVPVNWHFRAAEASYVLEDCGAKAVVVHADLLGQMPSGTPRLVVRTPPEVAEAYRIPDEACSVPGGETDWDAWVASHEPVAERAPARASMIYTSGTTGKPKGVRRLPPKPGPAAAAPQPPAGAAPQAGATAVLGLAAGERTVIPGPMYHSAPNAFAVTAAALGCLVVLQPRFDARELLELIQRHAITTVQLVPTMFVRMLRVEDRARFDLSSLRHVVHAAAPCPVAVKREVIEWLGPVVHEYYGCTESGVVTFCTADDWSAHPGTVGKALDGAVVRIYREDGTEADVREVGDVYVRAPGDGDFTYHGRDDERAAVERDGLITCGDMGYLDEDGYLYLADRRKDMVISGGVNIYPAEIEADLLGMPGVEDCAVFGIPDDEFGESVCAVVQPASGAALTPEAVRTWLHERIAGYKVPKTVEIREDLPREDSGKIFKRLLREPYWRDAGRSI